MQAPFPVAVFRGPSHIIELANGATLRVWGKTEGETVGRPLLDAIPELRDQPFLGYLDEVLRSGVAYEGRDERAWLPSGPDGAVEEVFFTFVYAPLFDRYGKPEGVLMSAFEVTAQVRSRGELERARDEAERLADRLTQTTERLRTAQKVARIGIFDWDLAKHTMHWSDELYTLLGLAPGAVEPTPEAWFSRIYEEEDRGGWSTFQRATAEGKPAVEAEVRLRQPTGESRWVRLTCELQYDPEGRPYRILGAVVDVQLLKEAAAARASALAEAERIGRAKDEFLATMSHELRTPLNAMLGWARMLRPEHRDPKKLDHGLKVIERNAETQSRLISDLLDVSRIISGKLRLTLERVTVGTVIQAAVDVVRQAADAKGVGLVVKLDPDLGEMVGDADRLQQIVWNLLSNAIKFTPARGNVTLHADRRASTISIRVEDSGAGLPPDQLQVIFERFQQVDSSTTRAHGGLGLGLAIVRSLVEAHGGTVVAKSEGLGHGATFVVTLPVRAVLTDPGVVPGQGVEGPPIHPAVGSAQLTGVSVLIVDDDTDSLDLLRVVLEGAGASVVATSGAKSALEESQRARFDVVISDIGMPEMDGYALMRALRAQSPGLPAIALTAYARREDAEQAHRAGFQRHLSKPVDATELVTAVRRLLRLSG